MSTLGRHLLKIYMSGVCRNSAHDSQRCCKSLNFVRRRSSSYDGDGKTSVQILNQEADVGLMINAYSQLGFRLNNGMVVLGPMAIFPRSVLSWNVAGPEEITGESLLLFSLLVPKLDILVVGIGDKTNDPRMTRELLTFMRESKINVEVLPTDQACTTFNFLNAEGRYVAGALIPPNLMKYTDDDVILSKIRHKTLYGPEPSDALV